MVRWTGIHVVTSVVAIAIAVSSSFGQTNSSKMECKCHSKQPAMKHMHETIGFTSCGDCHSKNENLMSGRKAADPDSKAALAKRKREDIFCVPCHDSQGNAKKATLAGHESPHISGTLYCAKDKLRFPFGTGSCPKCGGNLLNINAVMERSRQNPSNSICIECHSLEETQQVKRHAIFNSSQLRECLDCHQGHDDCAGCHR